MNKNLKKVISTIAALAVSASSMVAFATGYPDVPETATYAQAVKELSALNVISGYEDGTFLPDKNVTRAEITKMIVTSLGSATLSAANAAAGKDTKFADVPGSHWASGFVSTATANANSNNGFINGYDETTFGPDDNVTYAQAIKMLVSALGYQTYAENNGGWPNGYLSYGYTLEIADGVTGVSNDTQVTRAQVAQMIANAVKAPICVIDGYETQWNGTQTPNFKIKDIPGTSKDSWQCLLNYSHDTYVVNGRVTATQAQGGVDADEVKIKIEKANNYNGKQIIPSGTVNAFTDTAFEETAYIGESNADKYLFTYAEMLVQLNDDDELTILSVAPVGAASKTVEFAAEDFADEKSVYTADDSVLGVLAVYKSSDSTSVDKYELQNTVTGTNPKEKATMYVNGVEVKDTDYATLKDKVDAFIAGNVTGTVTLIDSPDAGKSSVDGIYDYVMVSDYKDAIVDTVIGDEEEATIYFKKYATGLESMLDVDMTNEEKSYSFTLTDGTELSVMDLQENDVLSMAYAPGDFDNSASYKVLVSRDTVEGKITASDVNDEEKTKSEYVVNGETYGLVDLNLVKPADLNVSYEYVFYLDAFGKIAWKDETATSNKLAILDNVYTANGDQHYVTLIMADGTKESYNVKSENYSAYRGYCFTTQTVTDDKGTPDDTDDDTTETVTVKKPIQNRVYSYSVSNSTGNVTLRSKEDPKGNDTDAELEYNEKSNKLGSIRINDELTSMLDAGAYLTDDEDIVAMTSDVLEDDGKYTAYGYNKLSDGSYQLVLVTTGTSGTITYKTEFVVYSRSYTQEVDGEDKTVYLVYEPNSADGKPVEVVLEDDTALVDDIKEGTPIIIVKNSAGYAKNIYPLFATTTDEDDNESVNNVLTGSRKDVVIGTDKDGNDIKADLSGYANFANLVRSGMAAGNLSAVLNETNLGRLVRNTGEQNESGWVFGMVYDRGDSDITIATKGDFSGDTEVDVDDLTVYDVDSDAGIITYSYKLKANSAARVANNVLSAVSMINADAAFTDEDEGIFDWNADALTKGENSTFGRTSFILAKTIDDEIVQAYVIVPSSSRN